MFQLVVGSSLLPFSGFLGVVALWLLRLARPSVISYLSRTKNLSARDLYPLNYPDVSGYLLRANQPQCGLNPPHTLSFRVLLTPSPTQGGICGPPRGRREQKGHLWPVRQPHSGSETSRINSQVRPDCRCSVSAGRDERLHRRGGCCTYNQQCIKVRAQAV